MQRYLNVGDIWTNSKSLCLSGIFWFANWQDPHFRMALKSQEETIWMICL